MSHFLPDLWYVNQLRDEEWDPEHKITLSFRGMELAGEVGELLNQIKKIERQRIGLRGSEPDMNKLGDELADVMICLSLICMQLNIGSLDFESMVREKFNKTSHERGLKVRL